MNKENDMRHAYIYMHIHRFMYTFVYMRYTRYTTEHIDLARSARNFKISRMFIIGCEVIMGFTRMLIPRKHTSPHPLQKIYGSKPTTNRNVPVTREAREFCWMFIIGCEVIMGFNRVLIPRKHTSPHPLQ